MDKIKFIYIRGIGGEKRSTRKKDKIGIMLTFLIIFFLVTGWLLSLSNIFSFFENIYLELKKIFQYFKMIKKFGWKKTREHYKEEKKELEQYLDPNKEERKEAIKRLFE